LRNAEIADRLFLTPKTVRHHVSAILGKLDVETRTEAARAARQLGITAS
jgi:DNA-binding NarL/FixJ family response regulator